MAKANKELLQDLLKGQARIEGKLDTLEEKVDKNAKRLDMIGSQVAFLEDDSPTREEQDQLVDRVSKVETKLASI